MTLKKALAGSLLAATVLVTAVSMTGQADPLPLKADKACKYSQGWRGHCAQMGQDAMMAEFAQKVGLSTEQKKQVEAIHKDSEAKNKPLYDGVMSKRKALYDYLSTSEATEKEALKRQAEIDSLRSQLSQGRLSAMFRVKALLTPEQQKKAAALMREKLAAHEKKGSACSHHHW